jgi:hypothetical protein
MTLKTNSAQKYFDAGLSESEKFVGAWRRAKGHVADAGFFFTKSRDACPQGEWVMLMNLNAARIKPRTVQFYIQVFEAAVTWVKELKPETPAGKIRDAAREIMMLSPKPLIALLRDLRELRPFGEYDSVKYAQRKSIGDDQLELDFSKVISSFDALDHLGEANFHLIIPAGTTEEKALDELDLRLTRALDKIRIRKAAL